MASNRKNFIAHDSVRVIASPNPDAPGALVHVGSGVSYKGDSIDLSRWLSRGIDAWVWASVHQLNAFLSGGIQTHSTVMSHGSLGIPAFFDFLIETGEMYGPESIEPKHIKQFIGWLGGHPNWSPKTQRNRYVLVKSLLLGMNRRGVVPLNADSFPARAIPNGWKPVNGEKALSETERASLADAIRHDVIDLHHGTFLGNECDALTVYILALGLRTGMNTTPLLELSRNALGPHPFMPNMRLLRSFKRRGYTTHLKSIRKSGVYEAPASVPLDGVALLEKVIALTAPLVEMTSARYKNHLWLHRKRAKKETASDMAVPLTASDLSSGIGRFVDRHALLGDDELPLRLNLSRLRKTMENRLWRISNGDLLSVALIMGQEPRVADTNYLQVTPDMQRNATIVGEALPVMFRYGVETQGKTPINLEKTPVGGCKDSLYGELAPRDGVNHCGDFMSCFTCRSYAIVGSIEDLHRLFSFYWFLTDEMQRVNSNEWREQHAWTLSQIDAFTAQHFPEDLITKAKNLARREAHKFWKNYQMEARKGIKKHGPQ